MLKLGINGLGRIGKCFVRLYSELSNHNIKITQINSKGLTPTKASYMLGFDSVHGRMNRKINITDDTIDFGTGDILITHNPNITNWGDVNVVIECSGVNHDVRRYINHNVKKVIISAPSPEAEENIIFGINDNDINLDKNIYSIGSCTTNCLGPLLKILHDKFHIEEGFFTTIHSYTNDQKLVDSRHDDLRRGRAANVSIIPTSTGAVKMIEKILPSLHNKIKGVAMRVPTTNVSMVDMAFMSKVPHTAEEINSLFYSMHKEHPSIIGFCNEPLVSIDFNHTSHSLIFDATQTSVIKHLSKVVAWYDNEWGFASRMIDLLLKFV